MRTPWVATLHTCIVRFVLVHLRAIASFSARWKRDSGAAAARAQPSSTHCAAAAKQGRLSRLLLQPSRHAGGLMSDSARRWRCRSLLVSSPSELLDTARTHTQYPYSPLLRSHTYPAAQTHRGQRDAARSAQSYIHCRVRKHSVVSSRRRAVRPHERGRQRARRRE